MEKAAALVATPNKKSTTEEPVQGEAVNSMYFSECLSKVIKRYQALAQVAFNTDKEFNRLIDRACCAFVNWNQACIYNSNAPELLARHTENILRRTSGNGTSELDILGKLVDLVHSSASLETMLVF